MLQDVTIRSWTSFLRRHIRPKATAATKIANLQTVVSDTHFELTPTLGRNIFYSLMLKIIRTENFLLNRWKVRNLKKMCCMDFTGQSKKKVLTQVIITLFWLQSRDISPIAMNSRCILRSFYLMKSRGGLPFLVDKI